MTEVPAVVRTIQLLTEGTFEIRILGAEWIKGDKRRQVTGYGRFNDAWKAYRALLACGAIENPAKDEAISPAPAGAYLWAGNAKGTYITLNKISASVGLQETFIVAAKGDLVSGESFDCRRWILVDVDPNREVDTSSTKEEWYSSAETAKRIKDWLSLHGWPDPVVASSGNGTHLLYRADLPHDTTRVSQILKHLSFKFTDAKNTIDVKVGDVSRICRLYGTTARKGIATPERPHRTSKILSVPEPLISVPRACVDHKNLSPIQEVSFESSSEQREARFAALDEWIEECPLTIEAPVNWEKGRKFILPVCPWDGSHSDRSAFILQFRNGGISAGCLHETCKGRGWDDLTELFGPLSSRSEQPDVHAVLQKFTAEAESSNQDNLSCTDMGNAQRFYAMFGHKVRYLPETRRWLVWNGRFWEEDVKDTVFEMAKMTILMIASEASAADDAKKANALYAWYAKSQMAPRVQAIIQLAKVDPRISTREDQWDKDPWLLPVQNGTIDLRTGNLNTFDRNDHITRSAAVEYSPDATAPTWEKFIDDIMCHDKEQVLYLQRALGYALTGDISEQCMFLMVGGGSNGKTTLLETIQTILGDYATLSAPDLITVSRPGEPKHSAGEADLKGSRFVVITEAERGSFLSEALVKRLTGEKTQKARLMHKNWFSFRTTFKMFMMCNHKPRVRGADHGIWRRLHVIPFNRKFEENEKDTEMPRKLLSEASGILNWLLDGLRAWKKHGIAPPATVKEATNRYRSDMDQLAGFLTEWCDVTSSDAFIYNRDLYAAYVAYSKQEDIRPVEHEIFKLMLDERGFQSARRANGYGKKGVTLRKDRVLLTTESFILEG